jgi:hypothetical protein
MIIGTPIIHDGTGTTAYYSPAFPRGGDAALFSIDVTHEGGSPTMVVTIEHKNQVDVSWTTLGTFGAITAVGLSSLDVSGGIMELVRYAFTFSAGSAGDFFHVIVPAPAWRLY